ncbi:MAG: cobalamin biosynthesis protein [Dehalococcoidia bacterium]|jgi:adenosylcobinamide-phosphate synthase
MIGMVILILALLLDITLGEPSNRYHPVAWLGKLISFQLKFSPETGSVQQFVYGAWIVFLTASVIVVPLYYALSFLQNLNIVVYTIISAYLLKNAFSLRGLWLAVQKVKQCLLRDDIANARLEITALVSRDTQDLSRQQLISASIESCAENLCDSFVAPLFFYAIFGLPGAIVYRVINTFDAMIGFHGRWEYTGKFAARLDDVVNYIPARISSFLIVLASLYTGRAGDGWQAMLKEHSKTESPNAGWTMGAMAGTLGIELEKAGAYKLGAGTETISTASISRSQIIMLLSSAMWSLVIIAMEVAVDAAR